MTDRAIKTVAVVGAGVIGASWAGLFLARGLDVIVFDSGTDAESKVRHYVADAWPHLTKLGLATSATQDRLQFAPSLSVALASADFVQESGPERAKLKTKLFAEMDALAPPHVILASSSSGLTMSVLQSEAKRPERCVIGHPFNPPHLIPLVEVVGGDKTSAETIERTMRFYSALGKRAIRLHKEMPGHFANRLQLALYREVLFLIQEGMIDVADADDAISEGPGLRWSLLGPNQLWHIGGGAGGIRQFMDHFIGPMSLAMDRLGRPKVDEALIEKIVAGVLARAGDYSVAELARAENDALVDLLALKQRHHGSSDANREVSASGAE